MYIVMAGNLSEGYTAYGPYADFEEAAEAADVIQADLGWSNSWIMSLHNAPSAVENTRCTECGNYFDDNPGKTICKTCQDWLVEDTNA